MRTFGLIGLSLTHSFSRDYFNHKFEAEGITDAVYKLFPLDSIDFLPKLLKDNPELVGLNVTIPYKEGVIPFLDELDELALAVGAVNTIRITYSKPGSKPFLKGFNTDVFGFRQSIKPFLESHHERALILGTGGAAKGVSHVLKEIGIDCYFVSREKKTEPKHFLFNEVNEYVIRHFPLIINTTPLGMYPKTDGLPDLPYSLLTPSHFLYDLIYNPEVTRFLAEGKKYGAQTLNGLSMLHQQAERAWEIWQ